MPLHPTKYAEMLSKKERCQCKSVAQHRMDWRTLRNRKQNEIEITRAMITAALNGELDD
jgi:ATP-dependent phosphoenolpyruvate carboxykinase